VIVSASGAVRYSKPADAPELIRFCTFHSGEILCIHSRIYCTYGWDGANSL
jgi:hypothetical protein